MDNKTKRPIRFLTRLPGKTVPKKALPQATNSIAENKRVVAKITANTVIRLTGLNKELPFSKYKQLQKLTERLLMVSYEADLKETIAKKRNKPGQGQNYLGSEWGKIMPEVVEIIGEEKVGAFLQTLSDLHQMVKEKYQIENGN